MWERAIFCKLLLRNEWNVFCNLFLRSRCSLLIEPIVSALNITFCIAFVLTFYYSFSKSINTQNMISIKSRIFEYLKYKRIKKKDFFQQTAITSSLFRGRNANSDMTAETIARVLKKYPAMNPTWLITGEGEMEKMLSD